MTRRSNTLIYVLYRRRSTLFLLLSTDTNTLPQTLCNSVLFCMTKAPNKNSKSYCYACIASVELLLHISPLSALYQHYCIRIMTELLLNMEGNNFSKRLCQIKNRDAQGGGNTSDLHGLRCTALQHIIL